MNTLFDKIWDKHVVQIVEDGPTQLYIDRLYCHYTQIDPVISQAVDILQKASASSGGLTGIPTGYGKLDDFTSGWQKSDLVIIAGRPAMGKTSFALSLAKKEP